MNKIIAFIILFFTICSCYRVEDNIKPKITCSNLNKHLDNLENPFKPLSIEERKQDWAKEFIIAKKFAKDLDLYRAITNFKRAEILLDEDNTNRKQEIEYNIILCYYLGKQYEDLIDFFDKSSLEYVDKSFAAFKDLLIILYESYHEVENKEKTKKILEILNNSYPKTEKKLILSTTLMDADIDKLNKDYRNLAFVNDILNVYSKQKKSVQTAQLLNVFIPGAGYLYVDQVRSAVTAFLLNGAFIYACYEFFRRGWTAAGVITASFEAGWYFGGIYGAGESANFYNERVYERLASPVMNEKKLFPVFLIRYGF